MAKHTYIEAHLPSPHVGIHPAYTTQLVHPGHADDPHNQWVFRLGNGLGLSVVQGWGTYGGTTGGTFEAIVAVWPDPMMDFDDQWAMVGDPAGWLTVEQLIDLLLALSKLDWQADVDTITSVFDSIAYED